MTSGEQKRWYGVWGQGGYLMLAKTEMLSLSRFIQTSTTSSIVQEKDLLDTHGLDNISSHMWYAYTLLVWSPMQDFFICKEPNTWGH